MQAVSPVQGEPLVPKKNRGRPRKKGRKITEKTVPVPEPTLPPSRETEGKRRRPRKGEKITEKTVPVPEPTLPPSRESEGKKLRPGKDEKITEKTVPLPEPKLPPSRETEEKRGRLKGEKINKQAVPPPVPKLPPSRKINQGKSKKKSGLAYEPGDYLVERIVGKRIKNGKVEYLIKWFQWPSSANTWEPVPHLESIMWMVNKYEELNSGLGSVVKTEVIDASSTTAPSAASSSALPPDPEQQAQKQQPPQQRGSKEPFKTITARTQALRLKKAKAAEDNTPKTLVDSVLAECPAGRRLEKIFAVAVVEGNLTFLVQWTEFPTNGCSPQAPNDYNSNMVLAECMNKKYPQEVIKFYESKMKFFESAQSPEEETITADAALQKAKERDQRNREEIMKLLEEEEKRQREEEKLLKRKIKVENGEDPSSSSSEDEASAAIKKDKRKYDRYSTRLSDSDLGTTSDEDILISEELD